jgi:outer membrane protein assembly factor BamB
LAAMLLRFEFLCLVFWATSATAADWPQLLGPTRDGVYSGNEIAEVWPKDGPARVWHRTVGEGYAGPVVSGGTVVLFHRVGNKEVIEAMEAATGKALWTFAYPTKFQDGTRIDHGPRATPTIADGRIYTLGPEGQLHCLSVKTGEKVWMRELRKEFGVEKKWHGMAGSPLIDGNALFLNVGGTNQASLAAFDKATGSLIWTNGRDKFSCSTPVIGTFGGQRHLLCVTRGSFRAADPETGKTLFHHPFQSRDRGSVNAASPVVIGDQIFISAGYGLGGQLLQVGGGKPEVVWSTKEFANQYATSIHWDGHLYGIHGQTESSFDLRCVEVKTGKVIWSEKNFGAGNLLRVGSDLLILTYLGELFKVPATPQGFKPKARAQIMSFGVRAYPAVADGFLYARSTRQMVCIDLRKP